MRFGYDFEERKILKFFESTTLLEQKWSKLSIGWGWVEQKLIILFDLAKFTYTICVHAAANKYILT